MRLTFSAGFVAVDAIFLHSPDATHSPTRSGCLSTLFSIRAKRMNITMPLQLRLIYGMKRLSVSLAKRPNMSIA